MKTAIRIILISILLLTNAGLNLPHIEASDPRWERRFFEGQTLLIDFLGNEGWVTDGLEIVRFSVLDGIPFDTLRPPRLNIDGIHVRADRNRVYVVGRMIDTIPGNVYNSVILVFNSETHELDSVVNLDRFSAGLDQNSGEYPYRLGFETSVDGRYLSVMKSGFDPPGPYNLGYYYYPLILLDTDADTLGLVSAYGNAQAPRFLKDLPWMRIDRYSALDLRTNELVRHQKPLGSMTQDGKYHHTYNAKSRLEVRPTDPDADSMPIHLHAASGVPLYSSAYQWIVGSHVIAFYDLQDTTSELIILDVSRNDTLDKLGPLSAKMSAIARIKDNRTVLGVCADSTVRSWTLSRVNLQPSVRLLSMSDTVKARQFDPVTIQSQVFPLSTGVDFIRDWGDGHSDRLEFHTYDEPGNFHTVIKLRSQQAWVDSIAASVVVEADTTSFNLDSIVWRSRLDDRQIRRVDLSIDGNLITLIDDYGTMKILNALTGSTLSTHRIPESGYMSSIAPDGRVLGIGMSKSVTNTNGYDSHHHTTWTAYDCSADRRKPYRIQQVGSVSFTSYRGNSSDVTGGFADLSANSTLPWVYNRIDYEYGSSQPWVQSGHINILKWTTSDTLPILHQPVRKYVYGLTYTEGRRTIITSTRYFNATIYGNIDTILLNHIDSESGELISEIPVTNYGPCAWLYGDVVLVDTIKYQVSTGLILDTLPSLTNICRVDDSTLIGVIGDMYIIYDHKHHSERYRSPHFGRKISHIIYNTQMQLIHVAFNNEYIFTLPRPEFLRIKTAIGLEEKIENQLKYQDKIPFSFSFPNPASTYTSMTVPTSFDLSRATFTVCDMYGRSEIVPRDQFVGASAGKVIWNLQAPSGYLPSGAYILMVSSDSHALLYRIQILR